MVVSVFTFLPVGRGLDCCLNILSDGFRSIIRAIGCTVRVKHLWVYSGSNYWVIGMTLSVRESTVRIIRCTVGVVGCTVGVLQLVLGWALG